jgi:hypothetical protein
MKLSGQLHDLGALSPEKGRKNSKALVCVLGNAKILVLPKILCKNNISGFVCVAYAI